MALLVPLKVEKCRDQLHRNHVDKELSVLNHPVIALLQVFPFWNGTWKDRLATFPAKTNHWEWLPEKVQRRAIQVAVSVTYRIHWCTQPFLIYPGPCGRFQPCMVGWETASHGTISCFACMSHCMCVPKVSAEKNQLVDAATKMMILALHVHAKGWSSSHLSPKLYRFRGR